MGCNFANVITFGQMKLHLPECSYICLNVITFNLSGFTARWSVVLRCFLKPHRLLSSIPDFSRYQMRRVLIIGSKTLHRQLVSAMGLQLRGSVWSLFGLGIGITVAALHWWGKSAEVHILFRISFRILSVSSGRCFNRLLWIQSGPGAQGLAFMIDRLESLNWKGFL